MIGNAVHRLRQDGFYETVRFYGKAYAWQMSPNYRQNTSRFKDYTWWRLALFVVSDYLSMRVDKLIGLIEHVAVGRDEIPRALLTEYVIRLVRTDLLDASSIVYAFGVSRHIETEEEWAAKIGCAVHLFDPTEPAVEFMAARPTDPKLPFDPVGVWTTSGPLRFYKDKRAWLKNLSVVNLYHTAEFVEAPCLTLTDLMKKYDHTRIDLLKMDIEGSALPVLLHMLKETEIRPTQIVGSLERPHITYGASFSEIIQVVRDKAELFSLLHREGYKVLTHHAAEFTAIQDPR